MSGTTMALSPRGSTNTMGAKRAMNGLLVSMIVVLSIQGTLAFAPSNSRHIVFLRPPSLSSTSSTSLNLWSSGEELEGPDRIKACVPYMLPLLDGDQFSRYIMERFPLLGDLNDILLGPLVSISHKIPFFTLGFFLILTLGTRFNTDMNRNVRFSAQQAALIDMTLILPELIATTTDSPLPRAVVEPCNNFVWYAYMSAILYSVYCNLRGRKPDQIPFISEFSDLMTGPF